MYVVLVSSDAKLGSPLNTGVGEWYLTTNDNYLQINRNSLKTIPEVAA